MQTLTSKKEIYGVVRDITVKVPTRAELDAKFGGADKAHARLVQHLVATTLATALKSAYKPNDDGKFSEKKLAIQKRVENKAEVFDLLEFIGAGRSTRQVPLALMAILRKHEANGTLDQALDIMSVKLEAYEAQKAADAEEEEGEE